MFRIQFEVIAIYVILEIEGVLKEYIFLKICWKLEIVRRQIATYIWQQ